MRLLIRAGRTVKLPSCALGIVTLVEYTSERNGVRGTYSPVLSTSVKNTSAEEVTGARAPNGAILVPLLIRQRVPKINDWC